ncbi:MAG: hypothetical protein QNL15_02905 [Pseudomonadales bacterium]
MHQAKNDIVCQSTGVASFASRIAGWALLIGRAASNRLQINYPLSTPY